MNKKELSIILSKLHTFEKSKLELEQYQTECDIAASIAWQAFMSKEVEGKKVADLGCGNGILGIAALILGAKQAMFLDIDKEAIKLAKENLKIAEKELKIKFKAKFLTKDVIDFDEKCDLILQNPPFGIQGEKHADRSFLIKAMQYSSIIYSIHSLESKDFIKKLAADSGFTAIVVEELDFPIKRAYSFHKKDISYVKAGIFRIERFKKQPSIKN